MAKRRTSAPDFDALLNRLRQVHAKRLAPPLEGYVYKFTIYLPLLSEGREVFATEHRWRLSALLHDCFGGFTESTVEGHPPWYGSWLPPDGAEPIVDRHTLFIIYAPQTEEAKDFFRQLRWILQQLHVAQQEVVLIEHCTVWLVETTPST